MQILFCDEPEARLQLYPLCYTRPISDLRCGILTIGEKWMQHLNISDAGYLTADYLQVAFPAIQPTDDTIWIFNGLLPDTSLVYNIGSLEPGEAIYNQDKLIAARGKQDPRIAEYQHLNLLENPERITFSWDLFRLNGSQIRADYELLIKGRKSQPLNDPHTRTYGSQIFLEEGARMKSAILNSESGPIYLGKNSEIQEGAIIRGPFGMGESSIVNMGAKVRGDSSLGPYCKIGGEVSNSILWGYSNKGHDGFLGNSVLGQWCNLGADTNTSNLKNTYESVKMWSYLDNRFIDTGLQFCGLVMGDHSKTGINTMFNTGTTVGVASNIFGDGFPRNFIPSFAWGGAAGLVTHHPRKALITADAVMQRRNMPLTETDRAILHHIFEETAPYRVWEKS